MGDFKICHEDVIMKLLVQNLKDDARVQFYSLLANSISSWEDFNSAFIEQFAERVDVRILLNKLMEIQIEEDELVPPFNIRFFKTLSDIPMSYRPNDQVCLIIYWVHLVKR